MLKTEQVRDLYYFYYEGNIFYKNMRFLDSYWARLLMNSIRLNASLPYVGLINRNILKVVSTTC